MPEAVAEPKPRQYAAAESSRSTPSPTKSAPLGKGGGGGGGNTYLYGAVAAVLLGVLGYAVVVAMLPGAEEAIILES